MRAYEAEQRSKSKDQPASQADLVPHLFHYLTEHGPDVKRLDTVKSSFRAWIGFLQQDELTTGAKVADVTKSMVARFRRWRMGPHSYAVPWNGKVFSNTSAGVTGETVQRNIEDLRAALHHAEAEGRITAPKIASVSRNLRSGPRDFIYTPKQLGSIFGYAQDDIEAYRWLAMMLATGCRPGVALAFDPATQWHGPVLDLQRPGVAWTDKQNPVVPVIKPLAEILEAWKANPHPPVKSRKRWWKTMSRVLGLPDEALAYGFRHTVSTFMDEQGVPGAQMSGIVGHIPRHRGVAKTTAKNYLHFDPYNCPKAVRALTKLFQSVEREATTWRADHLRTIPVRGKPITLAKAGVKA
ncbi:integrase [Novosphingobium sp. JCM 18896]|uniref:integrase n=1 Tax=Novosphingobium sp. JCM 18896 TaxID=2989731 RepID=UPI002221FA2A|nr:integrase [Novosphingobium sp. JCM 18896]MCW1431350.1 integrase [Novosphingobium sp. JCM 18896]